MYPRDFDNSILYQAGFNDQQVAAIVRFLDPVITSIDVSPGLNIQEQPGNRVVIEINEKKTLDHVEALMSSLVESSVGSGGGLSFAKVVTVNGWSDLSDGFPLSVTANPCEFDGGEVNAEESLLLRLNAAESHKTAARPFLFAQVGDVIGYLKTDASDSMDGVVIANSGSSPAVYVLSDDLSPDHYKGVYVHDGDVRTDVAAGHLLFDHERLSS